jgi:hypothetical protein
MVAVRLALASLIVSALLPTTAFATEASDLAYVQTTLGITVEPEVVSGLTLTSGVRCSPLLLLRTPRQVVQDLQAALDAHDIPRAMCNYAPWARVMDDNDVTIGRDAIGARLVAMFQLFGKGPTFTGQLMGTGEVMMSTWELFAPPFIAIPEAVDFFVVRLGQIHYQAGHAMMASGI